jgi:hypothetical protein
VRRALPEDSIHDHPVPENLQRLESFHLLVRRSYSFASMGIVIIHDHRIDTKPDDFRLLDTQSPQKHAAQNPAKEPHAQDGDGAEESLDRMGGNHPVLRGLDRPGIDRIIPQPIKAGQVQVSAIDEEAEDLLKDCFER